MGVLGVFLALCILPVDAMLFQPIVRLDAMSSWSVVLVFLLALQAAIMWDRYKYWNHLGGFWWVYGLLAIGGWLVEDTAIEWYKWYGYSEEWGIFVGHLPLLVMLAWPLVILGEYNYLCRCLFPMRSGNIWCRRALLCFIDISLAALVTEIICVNAGLWAWKYSNCLGVPFYGCAGWALYGTPVVLLLALWEVDSYKSRRSPWLLMGIVPVSFVFLHLVCHIALYVLGMDSHADIKVSAVWTASGILALQGFYQLVLVSVWRERGMTSKSCKLLISDEIPRLIPFCILGIILVWKGTINFDTCIVIAVALGRILTFSLK